MKRAALLACLLVCPVLLAADDHIIQSDAFVDFSAIKTFAIRRTIINSTRPELNNPIVQGNLAEKVRAEFVARKLTEQVDRPDVLVDLNVAHEDWSVNQWGRAERIDADGTRGRGRGRAAEPRETVPVSFVEGEVVLDLIARDSGLLIWRGVYRDTEDNHGAFAGKLPADIAKLLSGYPVSRKPLIGPMTARPEGVKTFGIRNGVVEIKKPEMDNRLFEQEMTRAIGAALSAKGLRAVSNSPDAFIDFKVTGQDYNLVSRGNPIPVGVQRNVSSGPHPDMFTEGTLVIDVVSPSGEMLWRGTMTHQERSVPALAMGLPKDAKELLAGYPGGKKK